MKAQYPKWTPIATVAIILSSISSHALTVLFEDDFQPGRTASWTYGSDQTQDPLDAGDTFAIITPPPPNDAGSNLVLKSRDNVGSTNPSEFSKTFHSHLPVDFYSTGDTVLQLNVDLSIYETAGANYRIGLYSVPSGTHSTCKLAFMMRVYPGSTSNNVELYAYNSTAQLVDKFAATVSASDLNGAHRFALQIDFSESNDRPAVRVFSNGKLLIEETLDNGGFDRDAATGSTVYIMGMHNAYLSNGAEVHLDNVELTSFKPGELTLGSLLPNSVNKRAFGHNIEASNADGIFGSSTSYYLVQTGGGVWDPTTGAPAAGIIPHLQDAGVNILRYPGGCLAHNYNWKDTIGPISQRALDGQWAFGLDEFLKLCEQSGAEPVITVSDYVLPADEMPLHAAQLVEYLNAPAIPSNPWAMKRMEYTNRSEPYGVKWFELGNESIHGNHELTPHRVFSAEEYADYAVKTSWAMRSVDPSIQIGILTNPGGGEDTYDHWNETVFALAGNAADYAVIHMYAPRFWDEWLPVEEENYLMQGCMAVADQIEDRLAQYRIMIKEACGHELALAVTEYNASFIQNQDSKPYRFTYGAALMSADLLRLFSNPNNKIAFASYWQFINGYWGMLGLQNGVFVERPAYPLYRLWGQHFGETFVPVEVNSPRATYDGMDRVDPAYGDTFESSHFVTETDISNSMNLESLSIPEGAIYRSGDIITVDLDGFGDPYEIKESYPQIATATRPSTTTEYDYALGFEARFTPDPGYAPKDFYTQLDDYGSASQCKFYTFIGPLKSSTWVSFWGLLKAQPDATGVNMLARLIAQAGESISGKLEFRNLILDTYTKPIYPAYPLLTASSSKSDDGKTLYVIVFNKGDIHIPTTINFRSELNFPVASAKHWEVSHPYLQATSGISEVVSAAAMPVSPAGGIKHIFPAHSMTAIELYAAQ